MPAYYVDAYAYKSNFTKEHDDRFHDPTQYDETMGVQVTTSVIGGRVHGNPFYESGSVALQESSARMREQDAVWRAAIAAGDKAVREIHTTAPEVWERSGSFHVIDIDDPTLVERGEEFVHLNYTDYIARNVCSPQDEWDKIMSSYLMKICVLNMEAGSAPPTVALEPMRQLFGLPYEWNGAAVED